MNYQYPYNNSYGHRKKSNDGTYLMKLSRQLAGVLIIMLILLMFKYVKNGTTTVINTKIKEVISLDYTKQANAVFASSTPNINDFWKDFLNKFKITKSFKIDYLPVVGKITSNFGTRVDPKTKKLKVTKGLILKLNLELMLRQYLMVQWK